MFNFVNLLFSNAGAAAGEGQQQNPIMSFLPLILMIGAMYFLVMRPQKKRQKEEQAMRDSIQVGDEVTTTGGIMGRVVTVKEDSVIVETGADRVKIKFHRSAIYTNNTANERMEAERQAAQEAKKAKAEKAAIEEKVSGKGPKKAKKVVKNAAEDAQTAVPEAPETSETAETTEE
jgi:preprotein translocase subunit YajC